MKKIRDTRALTVEISNSFINGKEMTQDASRKLEEKICQSEIPVKSRATLLGYYRYHDNKQNRKKWSEHARWFIQNFSEYKFMKFIMSPPVALSVNELEELSSLWISLAMKHPIHYKSLLIAGSFAASANPNLALEVFHFGSQRWSNNPDWFYELTMILCKKVQEGKGFESFYAEAAACYGAKAIQLVKKKNGYVPQMVINSWLFEMYLKLERYDKCSRFVKAARILSRDKGIKSAIWFVKEGLLALRTGNLSIAKTKLVQAARSSHKQDYRLAAELLALHEFETVENYLCILRENSITEIEKSRLSKWITDVRHRETPDFAFTPAQ